MRARGSASERVSCHISPNKKGVSDGIESPLEVPAWFPAYAHISSHERYIKDRRPRLLVLAHTVRRQR